jgi:hypothetical protein
MKQIAWGLKNLNTGKVVGMAWKLKGDAKYNIDWDYKKKREKEKLIRVRLEEMTEKNKTKGTDSWAVKYQNGRFDPDSTGDKSAALESLGFEIDRVGKVVRVVVIEERGV